MLGTAGASLGKWARRIAANDGNAALVVDQKGSGRIVNFDQNGSTVARIENDGTLVFSSSLLLASVNTETLSANKTLTTSSGQLQFLDPADSDRNADLPAEEAGRAYIIKNTGDGGETLTVRNDASTNLVSLGNGSAAMLVSDGTSWAVL